MNQPLLVTATQKAGPRLTLAIGAIVVLLLLALPLLSLLPADHVLQVSAYTLTLVGKILCYAIVALALDLVWGYAGLLSLGHGLFFALGGYAMGMYLMRQAAGDGLPGFMTFLSWTELRGTGRYPALRLGAVPGGAGAWAAGTGVRLVRLPLADQGRVLLDHDPGPDLRRHVAVLPQRNRLWRQQRFHQLPHHPGFDIAAQGTARCCSCSP